MRTLYLVRHAIAADRGAAWPDDDLRPLTARGKEKFTRSVAGLAALEVRIDEILTSPLVRARQTADLLASGLRGRPLVRTTDVMRPGCPTARAIRELARQVRGRRVALVGHEPGLGELAAALVGAARPIAFKKGAVCRLDLPPGARWTSATLTWCATPKMLGRMVPVRHRQ